VGSGLGLEMPSAELIVRVKVALAVFLDRVRHSYGEAPACPLFGGLAAQNAPPPERDKARPQRRATGYRPNCIQCPNRRVAVSVCE